MVSLPVSTPFGTCAENSVKKVLASGATNCTSTSPRQRLKKTSTALIRRNNKTRTGTNMMAASVMAGVMVSILYHERFARGDLLRADLILASAGPGQHFGVLYNLGGHVAAGYFLYAESRAGINFQNQRPLVASNHIHTGH